MSTKLKLYLGKKIIDVLPKSGPKLSAVDFQHLFHVGSPPDKGKIELNLPLNVLELQLGINNVNEVLKIKSDNIIKGISMVRDRANRKISFEIERSIFMKDVLENCARPDLNNKSKNIVIDFSSPNVAKPFHFGHLRSTIIGNFLSNLFSFTNNKVRRLNYLGDWGTQFGFVKIGIEELKLTKDDIRKDPIQILYKCYVHANQLLEKEKSILDRAKKEFNKLEQGLEEDLRWWREILDFTRTELESTYSRLGITFDDYHYESMYSLKEVNDIVQILRNRNIIHKQNDGKQVAELSNKRKITVLKSDGTSLYLTRDIAAAIDRFKKFNFDRMYYVVENGQSDHFYALKDILRQMDMPWADRLHHVKFGRIRGMQTRKGTLIVKTSYGGCVGRVELEEEQGPVCTHGTSATGTAIFLKDILDESKELVAKRQIESPTTKVPITDERTSDILGMSCVIVNDLKQRRQKDYDFDWNRVLQVQGDTGVKLQYTHCRLCSLEENAGITPAEFPNPDILREDEVTHLLKELAKFEEILHHSAEQLEACILVTYLFHLCNHISKALTVLQVKGSEPEVSAQRLLLFKTAKEVLHNGMTILGLTPLSKM